MKDEDILSLARERFKRCVEHDADNRNKQRDDIRFAAASPDDPWQWPDASKKAREADARPCLTVNKLPLHINQVVNDLRQNPEHSLSRSKRASLSRSRRDSERHR